MLRSIKQIYGNKLGASDGEIGHVKDFYFDDQNWAIRYLVVDTGDWLPGRQVLISPYSLGNLDAAGKILRVNLTRKQIEDSPPIETHKPVSRQYEEEYYRHYGWPYYWQGDALWGMSGFPLLESVSKPLPRESGLVSGPQTENIEPHLRSVQTVTGYQLQAKDGAIGHVCNFMIDAASWAIGELVIKTGHRFSGEEVLIPTKNVERISYEESTVFVNLTQEFIGQTSLPHPAATDVADLPAGNQTDASKKTEQATILRTL